MYFLARNKLIVKSLLEFHSNYMIILCTVFKQLVYQNGRVDMLRQRLRSMHDCWLVGKRLLANIDCVSMT